MLNGCLTEKMLHTDISLIRLLNIACSVFQLAAASGCRCYGLVAIVLLTPTRCRLPHGHRIYTSGFADTTSELCTCAALTQTGKKVQETQSYL